MSTFFDFKIRKNQFFLFLLPILLWSCGPASESLVLGIESPDERIHVVFDQTESGVTYEVRRNDSIVIEASSLGLILREADYFKSLSVTGISDSRAISETYSLHHGKCARNTYEANQKTLHCINSDGIPLDIVFNVSNDGIAFKYVFPDSDTAVHHILEEKTAFTFPGDSRAWLQPMSEAKTGFEHTNPSYEEHYLIDVPVITHETNEADWAYPALFKNNNTWVLITETGLHENYCGTRLHQNVEGGFYEIGFPQAEEKIVDGPVKPESSLPWSSPWRVIVVGSLQTIIESNMANALADPAIEMDTSFIKPGIASWSWAILKDPSITYDIQKEFIDFAADMDWSYTLVDVNWDTTIGYDRMHELSRYAQSKNVGLILWYNSAGDWNTVKFHPKDKLLTTESRAAEFTRLRNMGIKGIKVDFFGGDGQSVINYYHDLMKDAANYELLLNFHGATLPRGWHRTYPHLMTMESIKGFEFITFTQENADKAAEHCALIPFTRNVFDPMDFTPMNLTSIPNIVRRTSPAFELALPVLFLSGIQHIAETPSGMKQVPDYVQEYLRDIPTDWDETRFLDGFPGQYVLLARRKGETWHITGINAMDESVSIEADLSFISNPHGLKITDGTEEPFTLEDVDLTESDKYTLGIEAKGGVVMKF